MPLRLDKEIIDYKGQVTQTSYHVIICVVNDIIADRAVITIGSYRDKNHSLWDKESFVKPPTTFGFENTQVTLEEAENLISGVPSWAGAVVE